MWGDNQEGDELRSKINEWLDWDRNETTRSEIQILLDEGKEDFLRTILFERISFGTAGLRGRMGAGYSCMNDLVVIQTAQGLLKYLEQSQTELLTKNGIVLGYDARHNSKRFAELSASIFLHKGYPVQLFTDFVPTPFVPFAVSKFQCAAGVMVTASHNPKEDNGYKVYASNGSQIISPVDKNIQENILKNLKPLETSWDDTILVSTNLLHDPLEEVIEDYMKTLMENILLENRNNNKSSSLKFAYTAMHGIGYKYIDKAMKLIGIQIVPVEEQVEPDPNFPTVKFPNPEEGKSSLDLSFKTADANNCPIILANDPDADRLAIAEKVGNEWKVFNGNEIGALLGWWQLHCYQKRNPKAPLSNVYMLASTVSSKILRSMAEVDGFQFVETLTGFKWMGNKAYKLINEGKEVIFAYEEAIGFMSGSAVLDKDGVSAAAHLASMATHLYYHGLTLKQQLDEIYNNYGQHISYNSYFICHDTEKINSIFNRIRNFSGENTYPAGLLNNKYEIKYVRDLTTGYDNSQPDNKAILPVSKRSHMITFQFTNGLVATLRTSGTEPKIKYYTELCASPTQTDRAEIENTLKEMVAGLVEEFLQPEQNGLIPKSD